MSDSELDNDFSVGFLTILFGSVYLIGILAFVELCKVVFSFSHSEQFHLFSVCLFVVYGCFIVVFIGRTVRYFRGDFNTEKVKK